MVTVHVPATLPLRRSKNVVTIALALYSRPDVNEASAYDNGQMGVAIR